MKALLFIIGAANVAMSGVSLEHNGPTVGNLTLLFIGIVILTTATYKAIADRERNRGLWSSNDDTRR